MYIGKMTYEKEEKSKSGETIMEMDAKAVTQTLQEIDQKLAWISRLIDTENGAIDTEDFMHALKIDIFSDETFVFTPKGDVIALPVNSTLIDFAYAIHSEVGNKMVGAKINGMIAPIDRVPQTGDIVEVLTSKTARGPSRDWISLAHSTKAKNKIKQWFKKERREENIEFGRAAFEAEMKRNRPKPRSKRRLRKPRPFPPRKLPPRLTEK